MTDDPTRIPRIINQHVHDVRNSIYGLDLSVALVDELSTDPAIAKPLALMRAELTKLVATVNSLQFKFAEPQRATVTAHDLMQLWKTKIAPLEDAAHQITWVAPTASGTLTVDANAILSILWELVITGWQLAIDGRLQAAVTTTEGSVLAEVKELRPRAQRNAHEIEEARRLVERNGGTLDVNEDPVSGERAVTLKFDAG